MAPTSNFTFLETEYPQLAQLCMLAERSVFTDPTNTLLKLRLTAGQVARLMMDYEGLPQQDRRVWAEASTTLAGGH